jgi:signal transduction histidine kinase
VTSSWTSEPDGVEQLILYRIAREALVNIRKHVSNCHVVVELAERDNGWAITIRDEGPGFVVDEGLTAPGHLGLISMREKAEALAGKWHIESAPGAGTTVDVWIPYPSAKGAAPSQ